MKGRYLLGVFYILTGVLSIAIAPAFSNAGMQAFKNSSDVTNSFAYILMILAFTAFILLIIRFRKTLIKPLFYALLFVTYFYGFLPFIGILSVIPSSIILYLLIKTRHWIVVNISAIIIGATVTAIFGISMEPLPVIVLLIALAAYDYLAVYKTKHMLTLADSISEMKIPVVFIIPGKERDAIMGVGDAVMPNILVVSGFIFGNCLIQPLVTFVSGIVGLVFLLSMVERSKKAHPGLPILNFSVIAGYIIGLALCHIL